MGKNPDIVPLVEQAEEILMNVELAFRNLSESMAERKIAAVRDMVVFGRALTAHLSSLTAEDPPFGEWWTRHQRSIADDPLMQSFGQLSVEMLKERPKQALHITQLRIPSAGTNYGTRPRNARSFFLGDRIDGIGWEVMLPGNAVEKFYAWLPLRFRPPEHRFEHEIHRDETPEEPSVEQLCTRYFAYLVEMVQYAKQYLL